MTKKVKPQEKNYIDKPLLNWKEYAKRHRGVDELRVALVGPTGCGKTARVRYELAVELAMPLVPLILSAKLPEDIQGLPLIDAEARRTNYTLPDWYWETPIILFLDELDKAPNGCVDTLLTTIQTKRVHDRDLHGDTIIICAMQPVPPEEFLSTRTGEALASRMLWFPLNYDRQRLADKFNAPVLSNIPPAPSVPLPIAEIPSDRQLEAGMKLWIEGYDAWDNLVIPSLASHLRKELQTEDVLNIKQDILTILRKADNWEAIPVGIRDSIMVTQTVSLGDALDTCHPSVFEELAFIAMHGEEDDVKLPFRQKMKAVSDAGGICRGRGTETEVAEAFERACNRFIEEKQKEEATDGK